MSDSDILPLGKLPPDLLTELLARAPVDDARVRLGPAVGRDCAVIENGDGFLVLKSDPITFAADNIGRYLVQINANDIATTGALPRWLLLTMLLPQDKTTPALVEEISGQVFAACRQLDIAVVGGHTEITHGLQRPLLIGTLIGEVARDRLVTPEGAQVGDAILLTKGVPIEATAILARDFPDRLAETLKPGEVAQAADFLSEPGIGVLADAQTAVRAGRVTAMHDPTEGGLAGALWELAQAAERRLMVDVTAVPVPDLAARICDLFGLDPLAAIASGALLLTVVAEDAPAIIAALNDAGIACANIGEVVAGETAVVQPDGTPLPRPERDAITRVYETT